MKPIGVINTAALVLLLGIAAPALAGQEKPEEKAKPAQHEQQAKPEKQQEAKAPKQEQQAKPQEQQQQARAPKEERQAKPEKQEQAKAPKQQSHAAPAKQQQEAKAPKQEQRASPEKQQEQAKTSRQEHPATPEKQQQQASGHQQQGRQQQAKYSRPPQRSQQEIERRRAQPKVRLSARGNSRIPDDRFRSNFGRGHEFHMGNPVLVGGFSRFQYGGYWFGFVQPWPAGWYYTDDVYIDFVDGGYYMYDPYFPGQRIAISVEL